jgi:hypothetical protein
MDKDLFFVQTILSDEMVAQGFPLVYKGPLNHQTMKFFTSMAEEKISKRCSDASVKRKVFHVMVEMLQNITRHSSDFDEYGSGNGIFVVGERKDYYYVITGNMVKSIHVRELEDSIEMLNRMEKAAIQELHKEQMRSSELSNKGGAGLGLIDIIRKTGERYAYQFLRLDDTSHFFVLKATVHFLPEE